MATFYSPQAVTNGLVFCIDAANSKCYPGSGTTVSDLTKLQPATSLTSGATHSAGVSGYFGFDGTDDYIGGNNLTTSLSGGTMEIWLYPTSINRNQGWFVLNTGSGSYINFWTPSSNNMRWEVINTTGSAYSTINATTLLSTNRWLHFVGTFNGTTTNLYVNGTQEASQTMTNQPSGSYTAAIQVGRYDSSYPGAGRISIARFYNRALTAAEVLQNFNATRGRYGI